MKQKEILLALVMPIFMPNAPIPYLPRFPGDTEISCSARASSTRLSQRYGTPSKWTTPSAHKRFLVPAVSSLTFKRSWIAFFRRRATCMCRSSRTKSSRVTSKLHLRFGTGSPLFILACARSEEHTSELQSPPHLHSFPTRRSSDLVEVDHALGAQAFSRSRGVEPDVQKIVDRVLPQASDVYVQVISDQVFEGHIEIALAVWDRLTAIHPRLR